MDISPPFGLHYLTSSCCGHERCDQTDLPFTTEEQAAPVSVTRALPRSVEAGGKRVSAGGFGA